MFYKNADARKVDTYKLSIHAMVALHKIPEAFDAELLCFKVHLQADKVLEINANLNALRQDSQPITGTKVYYNQNRHFISGYASLNGLIALSKDERIANLSFGPPSLNLSPNLTGPK